MKFDLNTLLKEAEEDENFWKDRPDTLLTQKEIEQRLQQSSKESEQKNDH